MSAISRGQPQAVNALTVPRLGTVKILLGFAHYDSKLNRFWFKVQRYVHVFECPMYAIRSANRYA